MRTIVCVVACLGLLGCARTGPTSEASFSSMSRPGMIASAVVLTAGLLLVAEDSRRIRQTR